MSANPEYQTIRKNLGIIAQAIASQPSEPTWLADHLYQEEFTDTRDRFPPSMTVYESVSHLLHVVEARLAAPYLDAEAEFRKFVDILKRNVAYKRLAEHLEKEYRKCIESAQVHFPSKSADKDIASSVEDQATVGSDTGAACGSSHELQEKPNTSAFPESSDLKTVSEDRRGGGTCQGIPPALAVSSELTPVDLKPVTVDRSGEGRGQGVPPGSSREAVLQPAPTVDQYSSGATNQGTPAGVREIRGETTQPNSSSHNATRAISPPEMKLESAEGSLVDVHKGVAVPDNVGATFQRVLHGIATDNRESVLEYRRYLQNVYQPRMVASYDKLPGTILAHKTFFINLAVIDKSSAEHTEVSEMDKFSKSTIHWDIDDIIGKKRQVKLEEVGKLEDGTLAKRILVQGAPGVGKTTMTLELCRRWRHCDLLQEYDLVILLRLRDTRLRAAQRMSDLIYHYNEHLRDAVCSYVAATNGLGVLFIIEGFDELPEELQKKSIFVNLITGAILENASVMVTTRPSASEIASSTLPKCAVQHIEVVGFTRDQTDQYIEETIPNKELLMSFKQYLSRFPYIRGIMYVPLNCAIVVMVYKLNRGRRSLPRTQTELYTELTRNLLITYLSEQPQFKERRPRLFAISMLPPYALAQFEQLCKLAYDGIERNQLIFECLPPGVDTLGLFEAVPDMHDDHARSYSFLHLSLQEYLAAVHISKLSPTEQTRCFDSLVTNRRMAVVLRFLAGLTKFNWKELAGMGRVSKLFKSRTPADSLRTYIHSQSTFAETVHWLYESQDEELARKAFGSQVQSQELSGVVLSPFDCCSLAYCIEHSDCLWRLELQNCDIDSEGLGNLCSASGVLSCVELLDLSKNNIEESGEKLATALRGNSVLSVLRLRGCGIGVQGTSRIARELRWTTRLTAVDLSFNALNSAGMQILAECIRGNQGLTELKLSSCGIDSAGITFLSRALKDNFKLKDLQLQRNVFDHEGAFELAKAVRASSSIETISLLGCTAVGKDGVISLLRSLSSNQSVQKMFLPDVFEQDAVTDYPHLASRVAWLPDIATQSVVAVYHTKVNIGHLAPALNLNTGITELVLKGCYITAEGMVLLAQAIAVLATLKILDLSGNALDTKGARHLARALRSKPDLSVLKLQNCSIDTDGISQLAELLRHLPTLKVLDLSFNHFDSVGVRKIGEAVKASSSVKQLNLDSCKIGDEGITTLSQFLLEAETLKDLVLQRNTFGPQGAEQIAMVMEKSKSIENIVLIGCSAIGKEGTNRLLQSLAVNQTVQTLFLPRMYKTFVEPENLHLSSRVAWLPDAVFKGTVDLSWTHINPISLASAFRINSDVTEVRLRRCRFNVGGITVLAQSLSLLPNLKHLDLTGNTCGSVGGKAIAQALQSSCDVSVLKLQDCSIKVEGTLELAKLTAHLRALTILDFSFNVIGSDGAKVLAHSLQANYALSVLNLRDCSIGAEGTSPLAEMCGQLRNLTVVDFSFNGFDHKGIKVLAKSLQRATYLAEVSLSACGIDGEGMSHLAGALMHCSLLSCLELNGNPLGSIGMQELAKLVERSTCIECISVLGCTVIEDEGTTKLLQALSRNQSVQTIFLPEDLCTTAHSHLATRALWLPDVFTGRIVDLSNNFIPIRLASLLSKNMGINELIMRGCTFDAHGMDHLIPCLKELSNLKVLDLSRSLGSVYTKEAQALWPNPESSRLWLQDSSINGISPLAELLSHLPNLTVLDLSFNHFDSPGLYSIVSALKNNHNLAEIRLGGCDLPEDSTVELLQALGSTISLRALDFTDNKVSVEGARHLVSALRNNHNLAELRLGGCDLPDDSTVELLQALSSSTSLRAVDFTGNKIDVEGVQHLVSALRNNQNLTEMRVGLCGLPEASTVELLKVLTSTTSLKALDFTGSNIGVEGAQHLASALVTNKAIMELEIGGCGIGGDGTRGVLQSLTMVTTMTVLDLSGSNIDMQGVKQLALILQQNTAFTKLILRKCNIDVEKILHIAQCLPKMPALKHLDLSGNPVGIQGAKHLALALKQNTALTELILRDCRIHAEGISQLAQFVQELPKLKVLDLYGNLLGIHGDEHLGR